MKFAVEPYHGQVRRRGCRTMAGEPTDFVDPLSGQTLLSVPALTITETVSDTWCGHCVQWIPTDGVLGPLRFMARHRDGDCRKDDGQ